MTAPNAQFAPLAEQWSVLLTTYKRDGTPVGTAVNIALDGDRAFVRSFEKAGKIKRIRNDSDVEIAPCKPNGKPTGPAIRAHARVLSERDAAEIKQARELINRKHPIVQRVGVQLFHRLVRHKTMYIELTPRR